MDTPFWLDMTKEERSNYAAMIGGWYVADEYDRDSDDDDAEDEDDADD